MLRLFAGKCATSATSATTCSPRARHAVVSQNVVSPSVHWFDCWSNLRGVTAMENRAKNAPEAVYPASGSRVRFPVTVMCVVLVPTMLTPCQVVDSWDGFRRRYARWRHAGPQ